MERNPLPIRKIVLAALLAALLLTACAAPVPEAPSPENPAAAKLCERLRAEFADVTFDFYDVGSPFFTV